MNHTAFYFNPEMTNSKTKRGLLSLLIITSACIPFAMHMMQFYWENPPQQNNYLSSTDIEWWIKNLWKSTLLDFGAHCNNQ